MATRGETRINSRPPPTTEPGLFGRLLQRTRSKRERKPVPELKPVSATVKPVIPEPRSHPLAPEVLTTPKPARLAAPKSSTSNMGFPAVQHQQQTPATMLKKKASIRDRFRSLAKETSSPTPAPAPAPERKRTVYVPKHAAADFSRLSVSPRPMSRPVSRQQQRFSFEEPLGTFPGATGRTAPIVEHSPEDECQPPLGPRQYQQRGLQTLNENEQVQIEVQLGERVLHQDPLQQGLYRSNSRKRSQDQAATSETAALEPSPATQEQPEKVGDRSEEAADDPDAYRPSDYELFLVRAEAREQAYREHLLRSLSQRQYPEPRNSATYTADSAVVADASAAGSRPPRKGWEGRMSGGLDSGIGSKSSSQQTRPTHQSGDEPAAPVTASAIPPRPHTSWERGHRKRSSWTPSFGGAGRDAVAERKLEQRDYTDAVPEEETYHGMYTVSSRNDQAPLYVDSGYADARAQPRTLKRQTSIKQKLGAYIKPARPPTRYEESPELTRGVSVRRG